MLCCQRDWDIAKSKNGLKNKIKKKHVSQLTTIHNGEWETVLYVLAINGNKKKGDFAVYIH
jgi:hypothetical protein